MNKSQYAVAIGARPFADLRRGFIWASSGLLPVSKRASRLASPLARTPVNSPSEGLFVARERELEKGSSLTLLPYLFGYSPNCVSLPADLGALGLALRALA